ncbi:MAG: ferritin-like domain-containing protein [Microcoleaceae cyanobacterium]
MNLQTQFLHIVGSGASAYMMARNIRDTQTRPNLLAGFQMAEAGSVPFLETLRDRAATEGDTWLAEQLTNHAHDERRHGKIFAQALKRLNKRAMTPEELAETRRDSSEQRSPFFDAFFKGYPSEALKAEKIDWLVFMGSTYILELDASKDFVRMAHALPADSVDTVNTRKGILSIAQDETRHAAYLYEALHRRLPAIEAMKVIDQWRQRKTDALLAMTGNFIQRQGQMRSMVQDAAPNHSEGDIEWLEPEVA